VLRRALEVPRRGRVVHEAAWVGVNVPQPEHEHEPAYVDAVGVLACALDDFPVGDRKVATGQLAGSDVEHVCAGEEDAAQRTTSSELARLRRTPPPLVTA
jgi:hypothetical protein